MKESVGIIVNTHASGNKKDKEIPSKLKKIIGNEALIKVTSELSELNEIAHEFAEKRVDIVGISGGDGTLHHTISNLLKAFGREKLPKIFILCGGTMNTVAKATGLKENQLKTIKKIKGFLDGKRGCKILKKRMIKVGEKFGFILGGGLVTSLLNEYYSGEERGPLKAARVVWKLINSAIKRGADYERLFPVISGKIKIGEEEKSFERLTAFLGATVGEIGLGFKVTYRGGKDEKGFHFLASELTPLQYVLRLHKLYLGIPIKHRALIFDDVVERIEMEFATEVSFTIDGDMYITSGKRLCAEAGPFVEILAPD